MKTRNREAKHLKAYLAERLPSGKAKLARFVVVAAVVAASTLLWASASQAGWIRHSVNASPSGDPKGVSVGDPNNDGDKEIVTGGPNGLLMYDGARSSWSSSVINAGVSALCTAVSDADNDGKQEVVCGTSDNRVYLYENETGSWVQRTVDANAGNKVPCIDCGDADNDNLTEIVVGTEANIVYIYEGSGTSWTRTTVDANAGNKVRSVSIGDADSDGNLEIVAGTEGNKVYMYRKNGGSWVRTTVDGASGGKVYSTDVGDGDNDGKHEIAAGMDNGAVCQYEWDGMSWLKETVDANSGDWVYGVAICDADGDGFQELAVMNKSMVILYKRGFSGWLKTQVDGNVTGNADALATGDADDDGRTEIVVGASGKGNRCVLVYDELGFADITRASGTEDITISWVSDPGVTYQVFYSSLPDTGFTYAAQVLATGSMTQWVDNGSGTGVHPKNVAGRYYRVKDVSSSVFSNTVGKFTRVFGTEMHLTSIPLVTYSNSVRDVFGNQLTGAPDEGYADRIWKWDRGIEDFVFAWLVDGVGPEYNGKWWCPEPFGPSSMTLDYGEGFFVQTRHDNQKVTFVGAVPGKVVWPEDIVPGMQIIGTAWPETLKLDTCDFHLSGAKGCQTELYADRIWRWDEAGLAYSYSWLVDSTGTQNDRKWWQSEPWGPSPIQMMPGFGYWYQARGNGFGWKFEEQ
jgi:hypothetical protein